MSFPFEGHEVAPALRPRDDQVLFDLDRALDAVLALDATVPDTAFTAETLGTRRLGNGALISAGGLIVTIGYLVTEATTVTLTRRDGREIAGHALGVDPVTGFGLVQALEPVDAPPLPLGDARSLRSQTPLVIAGGGGRSHAAAGKVLTRMPFAGYWEYLLDDAIMTEPAHPHWSGAALLDRSGGLVGVGSLSLHRQTARGVSELNLSVPIDLLPPILDDLAHGRAPFPPRPWLGVLAQDMGSEVVVIGVNGRGPAARAELREGDVIVAVDGARVADLADFYTRLWRMGVAGVTVPLTLRREGDTFDVEVRSADRSRLLTRPRAH